MSVTHYGPPPPGLSRYLLLTPSESQQLIPSLSCTGKLSQAIHDASFGNFVRRSSFSSLVLSMQACKAGEVNICNFCLIKILFEEKSLIQSEALVVITLRPNFYAI